MNGMYILSWLSEYKQFSKLFKESEIFAKNKPKSVQEMLLAIKNNDLNNAYPNLAVVYKIVGTIAISSATAVRQSFETHKDILTINNV